MNSKSIGLVTMAIILVLAAVLAAPTPLDNRFNYQGLLKQNGVPVNGNCDLTFRLYDAAIGGNQFGSDQLAANMTVTNGAFSTALNFGAVFTGSKRWLEIQARCPTGSGDYTTLAPRQELTITPYAAYALKAGSADSMPWSRLTGVPAGFADMVDNDTLYTAGTGLIMNGTTFDVDTGTIQQRVVGSCAVGSSIRIINTDGTVSCETDDSATYTAGNGLSLSGTTLSVNFAGSGLATTASRSDHAHSRIIADTIGIGTSIPSDRLHIAGGAIRWGNSRLWEDQGGSIELGGDSELAGSGTPYIDFHWGPSQAEDYNVRLINDMSGRLSVYGGCISASNISCTSDARLKEQVNGLDYGLEHLLKLRPVSWKWKDSSMKELPMGLIAQEVQGVIPELVLHNSDPTKSMGLNYLGLVPVVIKAIQEQQTVLEQKEVAIQELFQGLKDRDAKIVSLEARLEAVEAMLQQLISAGRK